MKNNISTTETVFGITSLTEEKASPEKILELNRGHWNIENRLHWVRDVTYDEDRFRIRIRELPRVMASLSELCDQHIQTSRFCIHSLQHQVFFSPSGRCAEGSRTVA
ncbi:MAG: transposase [Syntrophorhabdales bacterium]|nr:transposase [Syntrophorhabdales bacterium]